MRKSADLYSFNYDIKRFLALLMLYVLASGIKGSGISSCKRIPKVFQFRSLMKMSHPQCSLSQSPENLLKAIQGFVPPLTFNQHKGQSGRIGVIGGSEEYTGAPYFAAISALKMGADLAHVFCTKAAAPVIKSYSAELIVHPLLDKSNARNEMLEWMPRLHAVVIGPGLGRDPSILKTVQGIIEDLKERNKPIVIDADGLFLITQIPELIMGYKNTILTPNPVEFKRLLEKLQLKTDGQNEFEVTSSLSQAMGGLVIVRKQQFDIIANEENMLQVQAKGSPRRCGGQGDLLSGAAAVFFNWALKDESVNNAGVLSGYAACLLSKLCAENAFKKFGRSTTTTDLINEIHNVFSSNFEISRVS